MLGIIISDNKFKYLLSVDITLKAFFAFGLKHLSVLYAYCKINLQIRKSYIPG